jgi:spermidine/putrescine transport system permease protein
MRDDKLLRWMLRIYTALVFVFVFAPIAASLVFSFNSDRFPSIPLGSFTTDWYAKAFSNPEAWEAALRSVTVAAVTAVIATGIGFSAAYSDYRYDFFGKKAFLVLALLPPTIPLIIMALAMLGWLSMFNASGRTISIILAHTVLCEPGARRVEPRRLGMGDDEIRRDPLHHALDHRQPLPHGRGLLR